MSNARQTPESLRTLWEANVRRRLDQSLSEPQRRNAELICQLIDSHMNSQVELQSLRMRPLRSPESSAFEVASVRLAGDVLCIGRQGRLPGGAAVPAGVSNWAADWSASLQIHRHFLALRGIA